MKELVKEKTITLDPFYPDREQSIDNFLQDITEQLTKLKSENYTEKTVCDEIYPYDYGYDGAFNIRVCFYRLETDEEEQCREDEEREYNERKERERLARLEKKQAKRTEEERLERAEYERLRAKYEKEIWITSA